MIEMVGGFAGTPNDQTTASDFPPEVKSESERKSYRIIFKKWIFCSRKRRA